MYFIIYIGNSVRSTAVFRNIGVSYIACGLSCGPCTALLCGSPGIMFIHVIPPGHMLNGGPPPCSVARLYAEIQYKMRLVCLDLCYSQPAQQGLRQGRGGEGAQLRKSCKKDSFLFPTHCLLPTLYSSSTYLVPGILYILSVSV